MRYSFLLFILVVYILNPKSQVFGKDIPKTPFLKNYTKRDYNARTQNWNIAQGLNNNMYFANNQGVLQFDGVEWNLVEMPNRSIVRTLIHFSGDTLLVGAYSEFGIAYHDQRGMLVYQSWLNKLPEEYRNFNEIWRIHKIGGHIIFQSFTHILIFNNDKFIKAIVPENGFMFSFLVNETLYVQKQKVGLFKLNDTELSLVSSNDLFKELEVWCILPYDDNNILIGTQFNGLYLFDGLEIKPWNTEANEFIKKNNLYSSILLNNGSYAFGSIQNGMIITNKNGKILTIQNTSIGLQNNTVLSLFEDNTNNLWLGLDNGIDFLKTNSPLSYVRKRGGFGTGYVSLIFDNRLYAGTNQGLFSISLPSTDEIAENINDFEIVESTRGQVWCLRNIDNTLYCGHNLGLFILNDNKATKVEGIYGVWDIIEIPDHPDDLLIGAYEGFYILNKNNKILKKIKGFDESARHFIFLENGNILVGHGYKGVYEINLDVKNESIKILNFFNGKNQLPNDFGNEVFKFNNGIAISTEAGIYNFENGKIENSKLWNKFFEEGSTGISNIIEVGDTRFWCFKDGKLYFFTFLNENMYEINTKDFLSINNTFPKGFENILKINTDNYLIGNEDGFVLYEGKGTNAVKEKIILDISSVQCLQKGENIYAHLEFKKVLREIKIGNLSYSKHRLKIVVSSPFYTDQNLVQYRYRINNGPWFEWNSSNELKLDDLREGEYLIDVQCSVDTINVADQISIQFTIDPPFLRTWYSYIFYLLLFFSLALLSSSLIKKRIENEKRREALKQKKQMLKKQIKFERDAELAQSHFITLRNERLMTDIRHKSKELANTTMSLINKNKILQQFNDVLVDIKKEDTRYRENNKINNLIKKINKEIEHQDNWLVFEENFDKVHENFLQRLKGNHTDLTPKDLRLAAYLRMNLSSKEIAPLLNISIRSVEISRYRLRKKMNLGHDKNLTEYIIGV